MAKRGYVFLFLLWVSLTKMRGEQRKSKNKEFRTTKFQVLLSEIIRSI